MMNCEGTEKEPAFSVPSPGDFFSSYSDLDKQLYILSIGAIVFGLIQMATATLQDAGRTGSGFYEVIHDLFHMPKVMRQLAVVQFFSWFALFAMWIYGTSAVTSQAEDSIRTKLARPIAQAKVDEVLLPGVDGEFGVSVPCRQHGCAVGRATRHRTTAALPTSLDDDPDGDGGEHEKHDEEDHDRKLTGTAAIATSARAVAKNFWQGGEVSPPIDRKKFRL